jgi:hypothetical protein
MGAKLHPLLRLSASHLRQSELLRAIGARVDPASPPPAGKHGVKTRLQQARGGQVGCGGSSSQRGGDGRAGAKTEEDKVRSDTARIRGSYRYRNYGVARLLQA